jgi:hypothetical protein
MAITDTDFRDASTKSGVRVYAHQRNVPQVVQVASDLQGPELLEYTDMVSLYTNSVLERLVEQEEPLLTAVIGDYVALATKLAEVKALMNSNSMYIPRQWLPGKSHARTGLTQEDAERMRQEWAYVLSRALSHLKLVYQRIDDMPTFNEKRGRHEYWVEGLHKLLSRTRTLLVQWAKLVAWEEVSAPIENIEDAIDIVVQKSRQ